MKAEGKSFINACCSQRHAQPLMMRFKIHSCNTLDLKRNTKCNLLGIFQSFLIEEKPRCLLCDGIKEKPLTTFKLTCVLRESVNNEAFCFHLKLQCKNRENFQSQCLFILTLRCWDDDIFRKKLHFLDSVTWSLMNFSINRADYKKLYKPKNVKSSI